jgi:hypothetical protein
VGGLVAMMARKLLCLVNYLIQLGLRLVLAHDRLEGDSIACALVQGPVNDAVLAIMDACQFKKVMALIKPCWPEHSSNVHNYDYVGENTRKTRI